MSNIQVYLPAVDGSLYPIHDLGESCKLAVQTLIGDDFAAPPRSLTIEVKTDSGRVVKVIVPYDHKDRAIVTIDGEKL
jgi:hypothetical protein